MLRDLLPRLLPGPSDVDLVAIHAKRPGITPKDIKLSRRIRASRAERAAVSCDRAQESDGASASKLLGTRVQD